MVTALPGQPVGQTEAPPDADAQEVVREFGDYEPPVRSERGTTGGPGSGKQIVDDIAGPYACPDM